MLSPTTLILSNKYNSIKESFLFLVRAGLGFSESYSPNTTDWQSIKAIADVQGLSAVVLDGINLLSETKQSSLNTQLKLEWIGEVIQNYEQRYIAYEHALSTLAGFYNAHGFKMMILKGYACSLDWPIPNHRPCGDIDIWQFGQQKEADAALEASFEVQNPSFKIDNSHHHHTVFDWQGFSVENHYDFLNVHHHKSNVEMELILKELGKDDSHTVNVNGERIFLPSANLHALFLLRHNMSDFASAGLSLRQLLDWGFFAQRHREQINWQWLETKMEYFGMKKLYDIFNAICVGELGFDAQIFPCVQFNPDLKDRILNDILFPEFSEKEKGGFVSRAIYKYRRWKANGWKHELCYKESMWSAFWSGVWGHLLKPKTI